MGLLYFCPNGATSLTAQMGLLHILPNWGYFTSCPNGATFNLAQVGLSLHLPKWGNITTLIQFTSVTCPNGAYFVCTDQMRLTYTFLCHKSCYLHPVCLNVAPEWRPSPLSKTARRRGWVGGKQVMNDRVIIIFSNLGLSICLFC